MSLQENANQLYLCPPYELVAPPRRSGRYGPAKGSKRKEEDDDGGQTRCVCNQQRMYLFHPFPLTLQSTAPLLITHLHFFPSHPEATPLLLLTSLLNELSVHSSWNNDTLVCLLDVVVAIFILVQGGKGQIAREGAEERERTKRKKNKAFPQLTIHQCSDLTNTALQPTNPTNSANMHSFSSFIAIDHEGVMIQCETCKVWQHCPCVGLGDGEVTPDKYYCDSCRPENHPYRVQNGQL